jgi:hypothetical protein
MRSNMAKKRITVMVDESIYDRLQGEIRYGFRGPIIEGVLTLVLNAVKKDGEMMVGALIAGQYKLIPDYEGAS